MYYSSRYEKQRIIGRTKECERGEEVMIGSELGL